VALSLVLAVMTAEVLAQWPVRSKLFQVTLAISFTPSRHAEPDHGVRRGDTRSDGRPVRLA
jgi:hypothetical protein